MAEFKFELAQRASIVESGENGEIVGRAEYKKAPNSYLLRYKAGDGRAVESWWAEDAIVAEEKGAQQCQH